MEGNFGVTMDGTLATCSQGFAVPSSHADLPIGQWESSRNWWRFATH